MKTAASSFAGALGLKKVNLQEIMDTILGIIY
jgi:hypothetical protein